MTGILSPKQNEEADVTASPHSAARRDAAVVSADTSRNLEICEASAVSVDS